MYCFLGTIGKIFSAADFVKTEKKKFFCRELHFFCLNDLKKLRMVLYLSFNNGLHTIVLEK